MESRGVALGPVVCEEVNGGVLSGGRQDWCGPPRERVLEVSGGDSQSESFTWERGGGGGVVI